MTDEEMLDKIFKIYKPMPDAGPPEYRIYFNEQNEIVCFSQEKLDMPYSVVPKEWYESYCLDLFEVKDRQVVKKEIINQNKLQLKQEGSIFYTMKNNSQLPVSKDYFGDKDSWDIA